MNVNVSLTALEANMLCEEHDKAPTHNILQLTGFKLDNEKQDTKSSPRNLSPLFFS